MTGLGGWIRQITVIPTLMSSFTLHWNLSFRLIFTPLTQDFVETLLTAITLSVFSVKTVQILTPGSVQFILTDALRLTQTCLTAVLSRRVPWTSWLFVLVSSWHAGWILNAFVLLLTPPLAFCVLNNGWSSFCSSLAQTCKLFCVCTVHMFT